MKKIEIHTYDTLQGIDFKTQDWKVNLLLSKNTREFGKNKTFNNYLHLILYNKLNKYFSYITIHIILNWD